jgi:hypothetical protein
MVIGAKQQPFLVGDLAQHLQVEVVQELVEFRVGPAALVGFGQQIPRPAFTSLSRNASWPAKATEAAVPGRGVSAAEPAGGEVMRVRVQSCRGVSGRAPPVALASLQQLGLPVSAGSEGRR